MADNNQVKIKVDVDGAQGAKSIGGIRDQLQGLAGSIPGVSIALGALGSVVGALGAVFALAGAAIREFAASEREFAKLDAALARTGLLTDANREKLAQLASQLQVTTGIADDEWLGVITRLVQFGSKPESIGMDLEAVKNLAGIVGNVTSAANLYSKALQGNYEAFGRYGVVVGDAGSQTEKLQQLQEQLAKRGGGQLEAATQTLSGAFARLKNAASDNLEAMGQSIVEAYGLRQATSALATAAEWFNGVIGRTPDRLKGLKNALVSTTDSEDSAADATERHAKALKELETANAAIVRELDGRIQRLTQIQRLEDELQDAQMAARLAQVDLDEASGIISKPAAIGARALIRDQAEQSRLRRAQEADAARYNAESGAVYKSRYAEARFKFAADAARAEMARTGSRDAALAADANALAEDQSEFSSYFPGAIPRRVWGVGSNLGEITEAAEALRLRAGSMPRQGRLQHTIALNDALAASQAGTTAKLQGRFASTGAEVLPQMAAREGVSAARRQAGLLTAEASLAGLEQGASGASQNMRGAAAGVSQALRETSDVARVLSAEVAQFRRELATIRMQIANTANR